MTHDSDNPESGTTFFYGHRVGCLPPGINMLDEVAGPRPIKCFSCATLAWFPLDLVRDEFERRRGDPTWEVIGVCLDCVIKQAADPRLPAGLRANHLEILGCYLDLQGARALEDLNGSSSS